MNKVHDALPPCCPRACMTCHIRTCASSRLPLPPHCSRPRIRARREYCAPPRGRRAFDRNSHLGVEGLVALLADAQPLVDVGDYPCGRGIGLLLRGSR